MIPPWWQSWWFRCLAASGLMAVLLSLITLFLKVRITKMVREQRRLESAVRERTGELEQQKDVVERQKLEIEELLHQAREVSRLKSEFLANMSHEIRTPMNGVIGMTQLALNTSLNEEQREYMSTVRDFRRLPAGDHQRHSRLLEDRSRQDGAGAAAVCGAQVRERFPAGFFLEGSRKELELRHSVSPEVPEVLIGDADRIRQVLLNLIGNAMKFTDRGSVTVDVSVDPGATLPDRPVLRFSVSDTGCGIPHEKQSLIFEAFAQVDGSSTRRQGGTGLGLAISTKLVHLMDGQISVESTAGVGSTFRFTAALRPGSREMLRVDSRPPGVGDVTGPAGPFRKLRILLAEDHAVNQKLAARIIEKLGHSLLVVGNGEQAVRAAGREAFDLILMDLQMPEMGGLETTALIRQAERKAAATGNPPRHVPIIAMTAHAMSGDREECLQSGMDDYISKPISVPALAEKINQIYQQPVE